LDGLRSSARHIISLVFHKSFRLLFIGDKCIMIVERVFRLGDRGALLFFGASFLRAEPGLFVVVFLLGSIFGGVKMLRSCKYCGRIHEASEVCDAKRSANERRMNNRKQTIALSFRRSNAWTNKSLAIRGRDHYLCLCCKAMLPGTTRQYETRDLSVHHITPIEEDYSLRLDDMNLITLCERHHEMCERGEITRDEQRSLVLHSMSGGEEYDEHTIVM